MPISLRILLLAGLFLPQLGAAQAPRIVINPLGHSAKVHNLLFTPDGRRLISVSEDKTIRVWNAETGDMVTKYESQIGDGFEGMFYASAISPDGKLLAVAGYPVSGMDENYIIIIDLEKNQQVSTAIGHTNVINALAFNNQGTYLASGGDDAKVILWKIERVAALTPTISIPIPTAVSALTFNTLTNELAVAHDSKEILVFNTTGIDKGTFKPTPKVYKGHKGAVDKIVYAPTGVYLASSSFANEVILWRTDGSIEKSISDIKEPVNALAFSNDAKILVGLDITGKGMSWSVPGGTKFTDFNGHDNAVFTAAFAPTLTGNYVVASAGGINNEIILWNPINGHTIRKIRGKGSAIQYLAFGEGLDLFIGRDATPKPQYQFSFNLGSMIINRELGTSKPMSKNIHGSVTQSGVNTLVIGKAEIVTDEAVDGRILEYYAMPDGGVMVASDFSLKQFDKNGFLQKELIGHTGAVRSISLSSDGKYLASGGEDQSIILWKLSESGNAPSLRKVFPEKDWQEFFSSLPVDSLTKIPTKQAWKDVITFLKSENNKVFKDLELAYQSLGEIVLPFATLFVSEDNEWVCWTPRGYFTCSSAGGHYFGWHINRGITQLADYYSAEQYYDILYRPTEMAQSLNQGKRVEEILKEKGERIFDLSRLHRPSVGFFDISMTVNKTNLLRYEKGRYYTQAPKIPLTVELFDGGGGIKEVNIYQNDKLIVSDTEVRSNGEGQKIVKTYEVEMVNETNEFAVKVLNLQKVESRQDVVEVEYTGQIMATTNLHVLAVGINQYQNAAYNLNYAQPDAVSFTSKVRGIGNTIFKSINVIEVFDTDATKENIEKGFKTIVSKAKAEDVFLFYYAGHGTLDEENNDEYYLVPTNVTKLYGDHQQLVAKGISATELKGYLTQVKAQKQIILMDACHSGGALKSMNVRAAATDEKAIVQLARSSGVVMIAASGTKQFATEFEQLKHGVFTYALLEALDGNADNNKDAKLTVNELKLFMEERVPELTREYGGKSQYPTGYLTGNDFPIAIIEKK